MIFTDYVIKEIDRDIASHPPERGGAILGPHNSSLITEFIFDPGAMTSACSYYPSPDLTRKVQEVERKNSGLVFKGVIHSHPGGLDRPSGQDLHAFAKGLHINPHMPCFMAPIVSNVTGELQSHEMEVGSGKKISLYSAWRNGGSPAESPETTRKHSGSLQSPGSGNGKPVRLLREDVGQMDCLHATETIRKMLCELLQEDVGQVKIERGAAMSLNDTHFESMVIRVKRHDFEITVMFPPGYPFAKPNVLFTTPLSGEPQTSEIEFGWNTGAHRIEEFLTAEIISQILTENNIPNKNNQPCHPST